jgi:hypothetical protein
MQLDHCHDFENESMCLSNLFHVYFKGINYTDERVTLYLSKFVRYSFFLNTRSDKRDCVFKKK